MKVFLIRNLLDVSLISDTNAIKKLQYVLLDFNLQYVSLFRCAQSPSPHPHMPDLLTIAK